MQKILFALCLMFSSAVYAQNIAEMNDEAPVVKEIVATQEIPSENKKDLLPACDDQQLIEQIKAFLQSYNKENPVDSLYAKRQRNLRLRSVQTYDEEQVEGFTSKQNRAVADKLLMTKINLGMNDGEFRICRSQKNNLRFAPVYLLMFQNRKHETEVHIMNFLETQSQDLMFVFEK